MGNRRHIEDGPTARFNKEQKIKEMSGIWKKKHGLCSSNPSGKMEVLIAAYARVIPTLNITLLFLVKLLPICTCFKHLGG